MNRRPALAAAALLAAVATIALSSPGWARPGGGEIFGGPSGDSGGGGGGGDVDVGLIVDLVILCVRYPALGGVVVVGLGAYYVAQRVRGRGQKDWSAGVPSAEVSATRVTAVARGALHRLRSWDRAFSVVLFEDFLYTLYAEIQHARPRDGVARLGPYLGPDALRALHDPSLEAVSGVIAGAMRFGGLRVLEDRVVLVVEFDANLSEQRQGQAARLFVVDRLVVTRALSAQSRPPARARTLDCPNCGAPLEAVRGGTCSYCQAVVTGGRFDWSVERIERVRSETRPPLLTGEVAERGNELPTIVDAGAEARLAELRAADPSFDPQAFFARIGLVFRELQVGWSNLDAARIRGYVSDNLFQYFCYWLDVYRNGNARNISENGRIERIDLANVLRDDTFDAITVRLFATGLDYTLATDGALLRGSRTRERAYTEYWTLIRGRAAAGRATRTDPACPNCGAPLKVAMAGSCEYCRARIVGGEFDWVLSRIEQDDVYAG